MSERATSLKTRRSTPEAPFASALRDGRAVIHMWEDLPVKNPLNRFYPEDTLEALAQQRPHELALRLASGTAAEFSMTLLPKPINGRSLKPYGVNFRAVFNGGYLMDFSGSEYPPVVTSAYKNSLNSGPDFYQKSRHHCHASSIEGLRELYQGASHEVLSRLLANPEATNQQLDYLGDYINNTHSMRDISYNSKDILVYNEVLAAASTEHLSAIMVPYARPNDYEPYAYEAPLHDLCAALSGLIHAKMGLKLPVVNYQVNNPLQPPELKGTFTLFARNPSECLTHLLRAMMDFQSLSSDKEKEAYDFEGKLLKDTIIVLQETLGIDLKEPLSKQRAAVERLKAEFREPKRAIGK